MILSTEVEVGLSAGNASYYEKKGYIIPRKKDKRGRVNFTKGTKIIVKIEDLMPTSKVRVLVKCEDCAKERFIEYDSIAYRKNSQFLKTGETLCSVCANTRMSGENSGAYKHGSVRYPEYRCNARKRNINFNITVEEFKAIVAQDCHYCGGSSKDYNLKSRGNGIDRKDSNIGYTIENCVPCCSFCNFIKNKVPYRDFVKYIRKAYERMKDYEV